MTKNRPIQIMIGFAVLSVVALIAVQVYWVSLAVDEQEQTFDHNVRMSLRAVADNMCQIDGNDLISDKPIDRLASNYFVARLQYNIDIKTLERLISNEFEERSILLDYEYGVYNCESDRMVFGNQVSLTGGKATSIDVPDLEDDEYYFGVYFPNKTGNLLSEMSIWKYMTAGTVVMLAFFSYGLIIVLRQKRLTEIQRDFIDNVTHELKTPLATLKLSAEALQASQGADPSISRIIAEETERLQQQVDKILEASPAEKLDGSMESVEIKSYLKDFLEQVTRVYADKEIESEIDEFSIHAEMDAAALRAVLLNLVDNAAKYGKGWIELKASVSGGELTLEVSDNGDGIPEKYQRKIFDRFFRVPSNDVHDVKGYGLGMYLVKQYVKRMNGKIKYRRTNDVTTFEVNIPIG